MRRFFVNEITGDSIVLTGEDHNHLAFVLRAKAGESIILCPQDGYDYIGTIDIITKKETIIKILSKVKNDLEPSVNLTIFMALQKGDKMDFVIQKLTEIGISSIYPMQTQYTQLKKENVKIERLQKIAAEASKQCGRGIIPQVNEPIDFLEMLEIIKGFDLTVFPYEKATDCDLKSVLSTILNCSANPIKNVCYIIGSEGGFSYEEAQSLVCSSVSPITLGKRILRAETACVIVGGILMYELGQLK